MVQTVRVGHEVHKFPDEATPEMIAEALGLTKSQPTFSTQDLFQPLMSTPTSALAQAGKATWENPTTRNIAETEIMFGLPPLRAAKYFPQMSNIGKGLLNYGADIATNAGLLAGFNALEGGSAKEGAIAGGGTTAVVNPLIQSMRSSNPLIRLGSTAAIGGLGTKAALSAGGVDNNYADLAGGLIAGGFGLRGRNAKELAMMNLFKGLDEKAAAPKVEAAERLGLTYIRPSEAGGSGFVGATEGNVGVTPEAALYLEGKAKTRKESEKNAIKNLYETIFNEKKLSPKVDNLYKAAYQSQVSPQFFNNLTKSAVIRKAIQNIDGNPIYQDALNGVSRNSFAYLDQVKRELDDMAFRAGYGTNEASIIQKARGNLVGQMDKVNNTYKSARALAQREIVKRQLKEAINDKELKGTSFYNKVLKNDDKFDNLIHSLKDVPEAQKQLRDMREVFVDLINPITPRTGAGMSATSMSKARSTKQSIENFLHRLQGGAYDMEMAKLMTDPRWIDKIAVAKKLSEPNEKARYLANVFSRLSGRKLSDLTEQ